MTSPHVEHDTMKRTQSGKQNFQRSLNSLLSFISVAKHSFETSPPSSLSLRDSRRDPFVNGHIQSNQGPSGRTYTWTSESETITCSLLPVNRNVSNFRLRNRHVQMLIHGARSITAVVKETYRSEGQISS